MEYPAGDDRGYLATGFRNVGPATGKKMTRCLTFLDSLPSFRAYKAAIHRTINPQPGDIVADLGCGLGFDVFRFAESVRPAGQAIGVDSSLTLLEQARDASQEISNAAFVCADLHHLPFGNESLSSCKVDRTLQHVEHPPGALREIFRTLRPGGVVACSEPDWGTLTIDHDNRHMVEQIVGFWARSFRNPWIGRQLMNYLREAGFVDTQVEGALLIAPSFQASDAVFDLRQTAVRLAEATKNDQALKWIECVRERDRSCPVWSSVTIFLNFARKPQ